ncbi:MAG: YcxB family protein [Pseudanabaena sp. ELA645]
MEPKAMIVLQCKLTSEDYIKAQYLHLRPSPWLKYLGIACLSLAFTSGSLTALINILLFGLIYTLFILFILPWNVRRIFSQQKTLQVEHEIVISPEMIETISDNGTWKMRLSDFHEYKVGKDLILLYQSQALFHIFPRRFFVLEEDFKTFLSSLEANLGSPKRYL